MSPGLRGCGTWLFSLGRIYSSIVPGLQALDKQEANAKIRVRQGRVQTKTVTWVARRNWPEGISHLLCPMSPLQFSYCCTGFLPVFSTFLEEEWHLFPTFGWLLDKFRKACLGKGLVWSISWDSKTKFLPILAKCIYTNETQNELLIVNGLLQVPLLWLDSSLPQSPPYPQPVHPPALPSLPKNVCLKYVSILSPL